MGKICGIDHVQLCMPIAGENLARQFYRDTLGLREIPKPPLLAVRGGVWFECGPLQLHLGVETDFRPAQKAHPALLVDDLDDFLQRLQQAGCAYVRDAALPGYRRAFTADPFGNRIELLQPLAPA